MLVGEFSQAPDARAKLPAVPRADPAVLRIANAVGVLQDHQPWKEKRTCSSSRGIITHLSNPLGMLANHQSSSSAREPLAVWAVIEPTEGGPH